MAAEMIAWAIIILVISLGLACVFDKGDEENKLYNNIIVVISIIGMCVSMITGMGGIILGINEKATHSTKKRYSRGVIVKETNRGVVVKLNKGNVEVKSFAYNVGDTVTVFDGLFGYTFSNEGE